MEEEIHSGGKGRVARTAEGPNVKYENSGKNPSAPWLRADLSGQPLNPLRDIVGYKYINLTSLQLPTRFPPNVISFQSMF